MKLNRNLAAVVLSFALALPGVAQTAAPKAPAAAPKAAPAAATAPAATAPAAKKGGPVASVSQAEIDAAKAKGMVWVNTSSKVYHMADTEFYGKTKAGKFMSEDDAKKAGFRAAKPSAAGKKKK